MDITDYNNRLSEARESYQKKAEEIRRNADSDKAQLDEAHRAREKSQRTTYDDSIRNVEDSVQRSSEAQAARSRQEIQRQQDEYNSRTRSTKDEFERQSAEDRNRFANRLNEIKDNYDRSKIANDNQQNQKINETEDHFKGMIRAQKQKQGDELARVQNDANLNYKQLRDKAATDKQAFVAKKEAEQHEMVRQNNRELANQRAHMQSGVDAINRARESEVNQMRDSQQDQIGQVQAISQEHEKGIIENYNQLMNNMQQRNDNDQRRILSDNETKLRDRDKEYNKDMAAMERRATSLANNGGVGDEAKTELERYKRASEDKIGRMKNMMESNRIQQTQDKAQMMDMAQETLRQQGLDNYKANDAREKQFRTDMANAADRYRNERNQISDQMKGELRDNQLSAAKTLSDERKVNRSKYDQQRDDYARRMNVMAEKNLQTIAGLQEEHAREKTDFIEKTKRDLYHSREELKDEMGSRFQKSLDTYQTKINNLESEKEKLVSNFDDKLTNIAKKSASEHDQRAIMEEQRRQEDLRTFKRVQEDKDFETAKVIQGLRQEFDKNLNEIRKNSEIKTDKMAQRYEDVIDRMIKENNIEMHRRSAQAREHYERLAKTSELEKEGIQNKYELKLQKMREALERARETTDIRNRSTSSASKTSEEEPA